MSAPVIYISALTIAMLTLSALAPACAREPDTIAKSGTEVAATVEAPDLSPAPPSLTSAPTASATPIPLAPTIPASAIPTPVSTTETLVPSATALPPSSNCGKMCSDEFWEDGATVASVQAELDGGADPSAASDSGTTPLHFAIVHVGFSEITLDPEVVRLLLDNGADPSARNDSGESVLNFAVWYIPAPEVLELLLEYGADANDVDEYGVPVLHHAVTQAAYAANPEYVKLFLDEGVDIAANSFKMVELLLEHGADAAALDSHGQSPLFIYFGYIIERIVNERESLNADPKLIRLLLEAGAEVTFEGDSGAMIMTYAMWAGAGPEIIVLLLEHGADAADRPTEFINEGETLLHLAAALTAKPEVFQLLLDGGADVTAKGGFDWTALHISTRNPDLAPDAVRILLDNGADPMVRGRDGDTPLHFAATYSGSGVVQLLLDRGADIAATNDDGKTACDLTPSDDVETHALLCP